MSEIRVGSISDEPDPDAKAPLPSEQSEQLARDETCVLCNEPINRLAGNPNKWGVGLPVPNGQGKSFPHHMGCVFERIYGTKPSEQLEQLARETAKQVLSAQTNEANRFRTRQVVYTELILAALTTATADLRSQVNQKQQLLTEAEIVIIDLRREVEELKNRIVTMESGKYGLIHQGQQLLEMRAENDRLRSGPLR